MEKRKRVKLITVYKNGVIANGFGSMLGKMRLGKVVSHNKKAVKVSFKDKDGTYTEYFHIVKGTRIDDLGQSSGWRINPSDWEKEDLPFLPMKSAEKNDKGKSRLRKLHKGIYPIEHLDGNTHDLIVEVWKDSETGGIYLRACREITKEGSARKRQVPALVPFSVLTNIVNEFKI